MTSSLKIENRYKNPKLFNFGPWYDHYIKPFGKCHISFDTIVLGNDPRNVKVCVRKPEEKYSQTLPTYDLNRYTRQLYSNEYEKYPIKRFNSNYQIPPNEEYNIINDFYKLDHFYNGTGLYNYKTSQMQEYAFE